MQRDELKRKFIIDENELKARLDTLVAKATRHCRIDNKGRVYFEKKKLTGKDKIKLALAARAIASELDSKFSPDITISELAQYVGLPENQVRARCTEIVAEHYADSPARGVFRAVFGKIEMTLDSISQQG